MTGIDEAVIEACGFGVGLLKTDSDEILETFYTKVSVSSAVYE